MTGDVFPSDEERLQGDFEIGFICLFCGREVAETSPDCCEINLAARGGFATFTCHAGCIRDASDDPDHFPDIETPGEPPPGYEPPSEEFLAAWDELGEVLGQIQEAELDEPDQVRSLKDAVAAAATANGVEIVRFDERD